MCIIGHTHIRVEHTEVSWGTMMDRVYWRTHRIQKCRCECPEISWEQWHCQGCPTHSLVQCEIHCSNWRGVKRQKRDGRRCAQTTDAFEFGHIHCIMDIKREQIMRFSTEGEHRWNSVRCFTRAGQIMNCFETIDKNAHAHFTLNKMEHTTHRTCSSWELALRR